MFSEQEIDFFKKKLQLNLYELAQITPSQVEELWPFIKIKKYINKDFFSKVGSEADEVAFIFDGTFKSYYSEKDGKVTIRHFVTRGDFLGAYSSLLMRLPSNITIQAIEDSIVATVPYTEILKIYDTHINWQKIGRLVAEKFYIIREQREYELLNLDAKERYQAFKKRFPNLQNKILKSEIASYLSISPVSLSRILKEEI